MKLVTFENASRQSSIGAVTEDGRIVDLHTACALYLRDVENENAFARLADALVPANMLALFEGGDTSLEAVHKAFDYVLHQGESTTGPRGETVFYQIDEVALKAPISPKKFFHTAGNFREHHEEATKAGVLQAASFHATGGARIAGCKGPRAGESRAPPRQHEPRSSSHLTKPR